MLTAKHMLNGKQCQASSCFAGDLRRKVQADNGKETKGSPCCLSRAFGRKGAKAKVDRGAASRNCKKSGRSEMVQIQGKAILTVEQYAHLDLEQLKALPGDEESGPTAKIQFARDSFFRR